jgi:hypothetical protein
MFPALEVLPVLLRYCSLFWILSLVFANALWGGDSCYNKVHYEDGRQVS